MKNASEKMYLSSSSDSKNKNVFLNDLLQGFNLAPAVRYLVLTDLKARYKRSFIGPFWHVISLGLGSVGIGLLWSFLWGSPVVEMLPSVSFGFLIWIFISSSLIEGSKSFIENASTLQNLKLPCCFFPFVSFFRTFANFIHSIPIIILVTFGCSIELSAVHLLFFPGLLIATLNLYFIVYLLAFLTARYRDLEPLVASAIPLLFFLSPVLFKIRQVGDLEWVFLLNPLTYLITIVRDPLLGVVPDWYMYLGAVVLLVLSVSILSIIVNAKGSRLIFWL